MAVCRHLRILAAVVCLLAASFGLASAQSVSSGTIHGTIRDQSGGVLPGVTATLSSPQLQVKELVQVTDAEGQYRFVDLPAGTYLIKAWHPILGSQAKKITVKPNETVSLDFLFEDK